jgi:hypothetical protein
MNRKTRSIKENTVRHLIRKMVREMVAEGEGGEVEQPEEEPAEEPSEDLGLDEELSNITDSYIKKIRNARAGVEQSDVIEMMSQIIDSFGYGNQDKLRLLQSIKQEVVR